MAERVKRGGHRKRPEDKAGSGIQEDGTWVAAFPGQRKPFEPGVPTLVKHGAYFDTIRLGERPAEIADAVRPFVPGYGPGVEPTLQLYGVVLNRIERGSSGLDAAEEAFDPANPPKGHEDGVVLKLRNDLRAWIRLSVSLATELGLTPASAARIMKDVGIGAHAAAQHEALLEKYRGTA